MLRIILLLVLMLMPAGLAAEDRIYRHEENGVVFYSSTPPSKNAKPAELPEIMRGEVKVPGRLLVTCDKHGGVNCQLGPDSDGSVICYDGFRDAAARFRFSCMTAKLELADVVVPGANGGFTVMIRNSKSVAATGARVTYTPAGGTEQPLQGPEEIPPFGVAEYTFTPQLGQVVLNKPGLSDLNLTCANCS